MAVPRARGLFSAKLSPLRNPHPRLEKLCARGADDREQLRRPPRVAAVVDAVVLDAAIAVPVHLADSRLVPAPVAAPVDAQTLADELDLAHCATPNASASAAHSRQRVFPVPVGLSRSACSPRWGASTTFSMCSSWTA